MEEVWKDIEGYKGLYQVSNLGRVKRLEYEQVMPRNNKLVVFQERILKQGKARHKNRDYTRMTVTLSKNSKTSTRSVARLVATLFVSNPDEKLEVHHINHSPMDNNANNLQWVDRKEQFDAHWSNEMSKSSKGFLPKNKIKIVVDGVEYTSQIEASLALGLNKNAIADAKRKGKCLVADKKFFIKKD